MMQCTQSLRQTTRQVFRSKNHAIFWILLSDDLRPARTICVVPGRNFHSLNEKYNTRKRLLNAEENGFQFYRIPNSTSRRGIGMIAVKILKNALKIRYLLLGGAIGGGYSLQKMYQDWISGLPDLSWMDRYIPKNEEWDSIRDSLSSFRDRVTNMEIDPQLREVAEVKISNMKTWFDTKLEEAKLAAAQQEKESANNDSAIEAVSNAVTINALSFGKEKESKAEEVKGSRITEEDLWEIEMKYQKELERLERENKELRQQILLRNPSSQSSKKVRVSLIDMYSDVLDELTDYDVNYKTQDHLPRVVVIGDQSSGKTSVLEMIAQARIFPRGAGEMMTRTPVKVTLSEGPYHIAQFKGSSREFDLTKETDLADLRREVEMKMRSLTKTQTVSNDVISMTVKGPGLQRMVLVDLPGIISTNTLNMAKETKEAIYQIAKYYMSNPNAIILCIQDGSVDAERSNVTDLISQMDPNGKRTIFVLTKVDLAEQNFTNPERIKKILAGELFPMKALGYFAVITGRGAANESIEQIKRYEEEFFRKSTVFGGKVVKSNRLTTRNLSLAVSDCFWKMVRETVEQQADAFKAQRFNLETEWKNKFPRQRILDRNELFEKARGEMLDEIMNLGEIPVKQWEDTLSSILWSKVADYVFENIFLTAAQSSQKGGEFNTQVDIILNQWAEQQLPQISVDAGWETLQKEFKALIEPKSTLKNHDDIFDSLKSAVLDELLARHKWEEKATEILRVLQLNALADQAITDKQQWDGAVKFLESSMKQKYAENEYHLRELFGPSWWDQWIWWKYSSDTQKQRCAVKNELEKIIYDDPEHSAVLSEDELTTVRKTLERSNISCDNDFIYSTWSPLYRKYFLKRTLEKIPYFTRGFFVYKQGIDIQDYNEVVLYWRIQQTLRVTVNSLRQQIMNREALRIDKEVDDILEEFSRSHEKKEQLLTGRRVTLAEELKRVKQIQEKLEEFIKALNKEKLEYRRLQ